MMEEGIICEVRVKTLRRLAYEKSNFYQLSLSVGSRII